MAGSQPTLLDILNSAQFQLAVLLQLGLEEDNIADFLGMSKLTFNRTLADILVRTEAFNADHLKTRLLFETENDLLEPLRLRTALTELQRRASELLSGSSCPAMTRAEP